MQFLFVSSADSPSVLDAMTPSDFPDNWHDLIAGYTLDNLTPAEQAQLDQLLRDHPDLNAELSAYTSTLAQLPQVLVAQPLPPNLEDTIIRTLSCAPAAHPHHWLLNSVVMRRPWYRWGGAAALVATVLLGLIWDNYRLRRSLTIRQQELLTANQVIEQLQRHQLQTDAVLTSLRDPHKAVYALEGTGSLTAASGSVIILTQEQKAILVSHNLPTLSANQVYRFWAATDTPDTVRYCGQFNPEEGEAVQWSLPENDCSQQAHQVLITIDPITAATTSGGELVMQSLPFPG